eukprot:15438126-Alexandrium_andersonii.AAC.1
MDAEAPRNQISKVIRSARTAGKRSWFRWQRALACPSGGAGRHQPDMRPRRVPPNMAIARPRH